MRKSLIKKEHFFSKIKLVMAFVLLYILSRKFSIYPESTIDYDVDEECQKAVFSNMSHDRFGT